MQQQMQQMHQIIETKQVEAQAKLQEAQMDNASREKIEMINASAQIAVAGAKIDAENARTYIDALEQRWGKALDLHMEKIAQVSQQLHDQHSQAHGQAHEAGLAAMQHQHDLAAADQAHQQTLQQGEAGHQQALEQGDQGHQQALEQQTLASEQESAQNSGAST